MRLEIMERDKFTCCHCRDTQKTLNVHHLAYTKGAAPWEYDPSNLISDGRIFGVFGCLQRGKGGRGY